jgi:signal transduction histidine kinase
VLSFLKIFVRKEGLPVNQNNVYRNFNLLIIIALLDLTVVAFSLQSIEPDWPVKICIAEFICFVVLLFVHVKGNMMFARYTTFLVTLFVQVTACVTHGKSAGFDYIFYAIGLLPLLFFHRAVHYISLFIISMITMLAMQHVYTLIEPVAVIKEDFVFYWNVFFTGTLLFLVMYVFKTGYERTQKKLLEQNDIMLQQKEEIEGINNNLAQIIVDSTQKMKDQEARITKFAYINAHKVRSPLARIIGLLNLISLENNKATVFEDYLPILRSNADELNDQLQEVSQTLNGIGRVKKIQDPSKLATDLPQDF